MYEALKFVLIGEVSFVVLWILFINVMTWKKHEDRIPPWLKPIMYVIAFGAYIGDILFNIVFGSLMFWQLPRLRRLTLTARMSFNLVAYAPITWKWQLSYFICTKLLEPWDWNHCGLASKD